MHAQAAAVAETRRASFDTAGQPERTRAVDEAPRAMEPKAGSASPATSTTPPVVGFDPAKIERPANNGGVYDSDADFRTFM